MKPKESILEGQNKLEIGAGNEFKERLGCQKNEEYAAIILILASGRGNFELNHHMSKVSVRFY